MDKIVIAFIEGKVLSLASGHAVILNHGIGYQVLLNKRDLAGLMLGSTVALHVHTVVKEDALDLYGFLDLEQKSVFQMCISVSGIGPKMALAILSAMSVPSFVAAVIHHNMGALTSIPGIGKKGAERLALELKDKALKMNFSAEVSVKDPSSKESLQYALLGLGYSKEQSLRVTTKFSAEELADLPLEILIKKALNVLMSPAS